MTPPHVPISARQNEQDMLDLIKASTAAHVRQQRLETARVTVSLALAAASVVAEVTESADIKRDLDAFQGIDRGRTVSLVAGPEAVFGEFEGGHSKEDKISAVHFVRFRPSPRFIEILQRGVTPVSIRVDHSAYRAEALAPREMQQEWLADLTGE